MKILFFCSMMLFGLINLVNDEGLINRKELVKSVDLK